MTAPFFRQKPKPDPKRLARIREMACLICNAPPPSEAAHIRMGLAGGMGKKPPDDLTVPMCHRHHALQHRAGEKNFWRYVFMEDGVLLTKALRALARSLV